MDDEAGDGTFLSMPAAGLRPRFGFTDYLAAMNPEETPEKTLYDLYCGLIALRREKAPRAGITNPEIKIEEVWSIILLMLKRHGYRPEMAHGVKEEDLSASCGVCL